MSRKKKITDNVVDGKKVKRIRKDRGVSRLQLASATDVSNTLIWEIEEFGRDCYVSDLQKLAGGLNVSITELLIYDSATITEMMIFKNTTAS